MLMRENLRPPILRRTGLFYNCAASRRNPQKKSDSEGTAHVCFRCYMALVGSMFFALPARNARKPGAQAQVAIGQRDRRGYLISSGSQELGDSGESTS
jgi:hypothetical protein